MTDTNLAPTAPQQSDEPKFLVGSYVLESLTTGMYVEPRDSIREYVQNAFDAIEVARREKLLPKAGGQITIIVSQEGDGAITVLDDGASIPPRQAWDTLTSIGASRKSARRHAGFRGIGRLGGVAYCRRLEFECKAAGQEQASLIIYDCDGIKEGLLSGGELEAVFRQNVSMELRQPSRPAPHYTEVRMLGLGSAPDELRTVLPLHNYLKSVAPVDFAEDWSSGTEIRRHAESINAAIPTVQLQIGTSENDLEDVRKPYGPMTTANRKAAPIRSINFLEGGAIGSTRWWGWTGVTPLYGQINESEVAGIRVRVKNLQLDGTEIVERILVKIAPSFDRLATWLLGEIHLELGDNSLIPNARRDGFEDSPAWRAVQSQIKEVLEPVAREAYAVSNRRSSKDFSKIEGDTQREISEIQTALETPAVDNEERSKAIARKISSALRRVENVTLSDYTPQQQRSLREAAVQLRSFAAKAEVTLKPPKIASPRSSSAPEETYPEFLEAVFEVLTPILDTRTFNRARKALVERFKEG